MRRRGTNPTAYRFLPVEDENLHEIPVGPVHAGVIEPGHFRFTADRETVARLEQRLGYVHKGIDTLMSGAPLAQAAMIAGRASHESTLAYASAFARTLKAALELALLPRTVMTELERIANHVGGFGAICNDAAVPSGSRTALCRARAPSGLEVVRSRSATARRVVFAASSACVGAV